MEPNTEIHKQSKIGRDIRTLLFCRVSPKDIDHVEVYKEISKLNLNHQNNAKSFFALGGFDALCIYPTEIQPTSKNWLGQIYTDKQRIIHSINPNVIYHQMHLVTQQDTGDFWCKETEKDYPFFLATFVYGVQNKGHNADKEAHWIKLDKKECSIYEHSILKYLREHTDKSESPAIHSNKIKYAVYNGISISDVVILWRTKDIRSTLEFISSIEQQGIARRTLTTVSFPMNAQGLIREDAFTTLRAPQLNTEGISVSIRGSVRDMEKFKLVYDMLKKVLGEQKYFENCGRNDFTITADVTWGSIADLLEIYTRQHKEISDACWEIHTDLQLPSHDGWKQQTYRASATPTDILSGEYKKFLQYRELYHLDKYPWCHAMVELLGTHSNIDHNPVLHGPSYLIYKSLKIANAYFAGQVEDFTNRKIVDSLLIESRDSLLRFIRNWDQLTEQIIRNDDVMLSGRSNSHTIHISLPENALDFYHAFLRKVVDFLVAYDDRFGRKPENFEYDFLLSPEISNRFRFSSMFRTDIKYRSEDSQKRIWPEKQAYILELPLESVFEPLQAFIPMVHECFHCFGDILRNREVRRQYMSLFIAANIVTAGNFGSSRYNRLLAETAKFIHGPVPCQTEPYLTQTYNDLMQNTYSILGHNGIDTLFNALGDAYYLYSDNALTKWNAAKNSFIRADSSHTISAESVVNACLYYFKECYADAMTIALLRLTPQEYLSLFRSEIALFDDPGRIWKSNDRESHIKQSASGMAALAQRMAVVMATCTNYNKVTIFDPQDCYNAISTLATEDSGQFRIFAQILHDCYVPLIDRHVAMPSGGSFHPVCALEYIRNYLEESINILFDAPPVLTTIAENGEEPYCLDDLSKDFNDIIREGDMFGKRFYQIIYEQYSDVRKKVKTKESSVQ